MFVLTRTAMYVSDWLIHLPITQLSTEKEEDCPGYNTPCSPATATTTAYIFTIGIPCCDFERHEERVKEEFSV